MPVSVYCRKNTSVQIAKLRRCMIGLLKYTGMENAHLEVSLVGEKQIRELNRRFLKRNRVTDVISFPMNIRQVFHHVPWHLGEIFIATPVALHQAKQAGRTVTAQVIRLGVHGLVHLQGLDHEGGREARRLFEARERRFLKFLDRKGFYQWDGLLQF
jgi:probable rRNA maturation factor